MSLTICTCTLHVYDTLGNAFSTAELVWEPRKSMIDSGTGVYIPRQQRATAVNGVCTLALVQSTTDSQLGVFTLNWDVAGSSSGSVIFDPVEIPNASTLDLSTLLTVSRG